MILEHAVLEVAPERRLAYEAALTEALPLIAATPGFLGCEVRPCLEQAGRYLLLVKWQMLANHEQDFRQSARYQQWRALLHHFYLTVPTVDHYGDSVVMG